MYTVCLTGVYMALVSSDDVYSYATVLETHDIYLDSVRPLNPFYKVFIFRSEKHTN